jgi:disulfide bond formation protein DsbB
MSGFCSQIVTLPRAAQVLLAASLGALGFVLVMQYGFGLHPCVLCLWQRVPYGVTALLALAVLVNRRHAVILLGLCAACYLAGMGVAFFHSGVELHWWLGTSSCGIQPLAAGDAEAMRQSLLQTITPRCDEIAWTFLGLSMANWNIALSFLLALFAAASAAKTAQD